MSGRPLQSFVSAQHNPCQWDEPKIFNASTAPESWVSETQPASRTWAKQIECVDRTRGLRRYKLQFSLINRLSRPRGQRNTSREKHKTSYRLELVCIDASFIFLAKKVIFIQAFIPHFVPSIFYVAHMSLRIGEVLTSWKHESFPHILPIFDDGKTYTILSKQKYSKWHKKKELSLSLCTSSELRNCKFISLS